MTPPVSSRRTRPYCAGSSGSIVAIVAAASLPSCASMSALIASGVISGTSPLMTTTVDSGSMFRLAAATAPPVPLGSGWTATSTPSGSQSSSRRLGVSTTTTLPAPASCAAVTGQRISGRPQSGCRTLGSAERMRVPSPAAMMTTVGADTARIVVSGRLYFGGESSNRPGHRVLVPGIRVRVLAPQLVLPFESVRRSCEHVFVPRYAEAELRAVVCTASSMTEVLRHFGLRPAGGNHRLLRRWLIAWDISIDHFTGTPPPRRRERIPLDEVLVENSPYSRHTLKQRLYEAGLKDRVCELCGQNELWNGRHMSLILDHLNGVADDNRLENLRIVCPNCNATLETHCGKANLRTVRDQSCERCGAAFRPKSARQRFCSRACGTRWERGGRPRPGARRVNRPPYAQLVREAKQLGWSAVGRRY